MSLERRYFHQIKNVIQAFDGAQLAFERKQPVDNQLSRFFRKNKRFGSKDRKLISGAIFGFFRWYGWLQVLIPEQKEKALLLGYLLDENPVDAFIQFWMDQNKLRSTWDKHFESEGLSTLNEKEKFISRVLHDTDSKSLNPTFVPSWMLNLTEAFQKRPDRWLRMISSQNQRFYSFLAEKKVSFETHPILSKAIGITSGINLNESSDFRTGDVVVQDIASQGIGLVCAPQKNQIWWDVCAGSGGKSLHLAALMEGSGKIYATDIRPSALKALDKRNHGKWKNIRTIREKKTPL